MLLLSHLVYGFPAQFAGIALAAANGIGLTVNRPSVYGLCFGFQRSFHMDARRL
jgi:hypothetical protein